MDGRKGILIIYVCKKEGYFDFKCMYVQYVSIDDVRSIA